MRGFWSPRVPPPAPYRIDVSYSAATHRLEGTETIPFRNETLRSIDCIALRWFGDVMDARANGTLLVKSPGSQSIALFALTHP